MNIREIFFLIIWLIKMHIYGGKNHIIFLFSKSFLLNDQNNVTFIFTRIWTHPVTLLYQITWDVITTQILQLSHISQLSFQTKQIFNLLILNELTIPYNYPKYNKDHNKLSNSLTHPFCPGFCVQFLNDYVLICLLFSQTKAHHLILSIRYTRTLST